MRWKIYPESVWKPHFAWFPVSAKGYIDQEYKVWLEWIWRREIITEAPPDSLLSPAPQYEYKIYL